MHANQGLSDFLIFPSDRSSWVGSDWSWSELLISGALASALVLAYCYQNKQVKGRGTLVEIK